MALRLKTRMRRMPPPVKNAMWRLAEPVDGLVRAAYRVRTGDRRPIPPLSIRGHVGAHSPSGYIGGARAIYEGLERVLAEAGRPLSTMGDVLDFACGSGRVSMYLAENYPGLRIAACDVDAASIEWAARHIEGPRFFATGSSPPLPFEDASFDLVFAYSLWTHLSQSDQTKWLAEVRRILRPDAIAILTTLGPGAWDWITRDEEFLQSKAFMNRLRTAGDARTEGLVFVPYDDATASGPGLRGIEGEYGLTFQSAEYTREQWSALLDVVDVLPNAIAQQDAVLVTRPSA